jgi:hypothetical protein
MSIPSFHPQVTIPQWLELPMPVRLRLKDIFNVPRSSGTEVHNQTVVSDGHTHKDLANITVEKMQEFLGVSEIKGEKDLFFGLWNATAGKAYMQWEQDMEENMDSLEEEKMRLGKEKIDAMRELAKEVETFADQVQQAVPKKRGRPKKATV